MCLKFNYILHIEVCALHYILHPDGFISEDNLRTIIYKVLMVEFKVYHISTPIMYYTFAYISLYLEDDFSRKLSFSLFFQDSCLNMYLYLV